MLDIQTVAEKIHEIVSDASRFAFPSIGVLCSQKQFDELRRLTVNLWDTTQPSRLTFRPSGGRIDVLRLWGGSRYYKHDCNYAFVPSEWDVDDYRDRLTTGAKILVVAA